MRKIGKALLYITYLVLAVFVLLEGFVRVLGYAEMYLYDPLYMPFAQSKEIPFVLKPNLADVRAHGNIRINTDELGLRSLTPGAKHPPKAPGEYRLAFVGNSVTFGVGVSTAETYPEVVETTLNRLQNHCRVKVFNFAVSSYSVKEMTATMKYRVAAVAPDLVVMGIFINDFNTKRTPGVDAWGYNTHSESAIINKYPYLKLLLRNIHLSYVIRDALTRMSGQKGEFDSVPGKLPGWIASSYGCLIDFKQIAAAHGYPYLILTLPSCGEDGSQFREVINQFHRDKLNYCDVSALANSFTAGEYRSSRFDFHPSARVHQQIGEMLSAYILEKYLDRACRKNQ